MVQKKWFKDILIFYLIVGHTHEKVDRDLFATIGNLKKVKDCPTPEKFPGFVSKSFTKTNQKPLFRPNPLFWNWKQYMAGNIRSIKNLGGFRAFLIKLNSLSQPELFFKKSMLDLQWLGFEGSTSQGTFFFVFNLIFIGIQILQEIPNGTPNILQPQIIPSEMLKDIPKLLENLKPKYQNWWKDWLIDQTLPSIVLPEGNICFFLIYNICRYCLGFLASRSLCRGSGK